MKTTFAAFFTLVLAVSAQQPDVFRAWDRDQNGQLSREELPEGLRKNFDRVDTDKNGSISREEHNVIARRQNPRQRLDLYLPEKREGTAPLPVIVFIHGGGWRGGDKAGGISNVGRFVSSGRFAGASIGYRLTGEAQWPAQIHDCKAAIRWIKAHAKEHGLDPEKIAVWGSSAGGHLVSFLGTSGDVPTLEGTLGKHTDQNSRVRCVVNFFGPENFLTMVTQESTVDRTTPDYPEALLLGGRVQEKQEAAKEASPVTHISAGDAPFLTAHGTKDPLVPYAQATELDATLKKAGVESLLIEMTNGGHGFRSEELDRRIAQFFDKQLLGIDSVISTEPIAVTAKR